MQSALGKFREGTSMSLLAKSPEASVGGRDHAERNHHAQKPGLNLHNVKDVVRRARNKANVMFAPEVVDAIANINILPNSTTVLGVDFTSRCNLRCIYCFQSQLPTYYYESATDQTSFDIDEELINNIIRIAKDWKVGRFLVGFAGETIIVNRWSEYLGRLIETGIPVTITSNFSKILSKEEALVMSRCDTINISIDVMDFKLARDIRQKSDTRTIIYNLMLVKAIATAARRPEPHFVFCCVLSDVAALELKYLVSLAKSAGVSSISLMGLDTDYTEKYNKNLGRVVLSKVGTLTGGQRERAREALGSALTLAKAEGINIWMNDGAKLALTENEDVEVGSGAGKWTRACFQPWMQPMIKANTGVEPCCHGYGEVGQLSNERDFKTIFNGTEMVALRRELLSGELSSICSGCTLPRRVSTREFAQQILARLHEAPDGSAVFGDPDAPPPTLGRIRYAIRWRRSQGQGWIRIAKDATVRIRKFVS
jgi:MoaA/NifB/PqqE/SkfB family radical SAM enzyme